MKQGRVYIVGAGPGDPGLITLKGLRCIERADVVIYDYLVNADLLGSARKDAEKIYAGKQGGAHTLTQEAINALLVEKAGEGKTVCRLKGGDPLIFGRGGEEAEALVAAGLPFEIVPGVTSAIAAPAYAGIPLTHRGLTSTVAFVTGHEDPTKAETDIDWKALAGIGTLVFLMGVKNLAEIAANLMAAGKDADTPTGLIRWGTTPAQKTLTATLGTIAAWAAEKKFAPPAILIVGDVVSLRERLAWFESKPLFGKGVVITRPEAQAGEFATLLADAGARPILFPTIAIVPPPSWRGLDAALDRLFTFDWIVFTSANGVRFFLERLRQTGRDLRDLKGIRLATIGPATAKILEAKGLKVDLIPESFISEGVVKAFGKVGLKGKKVLLSRAEKARDVIPEGLSSLGADVEVVTVYRTVPSDRRQEEFVQLLHAGQVDVIAFTSPSTVENFVTLMGEGFRLPATVKIAAIGPVTAEAVAQAGMAVDILQETYTIPGLVLGLKTFFRDYRPAQR